MIELTTEELSERSGTTEESVKATLALGWTVPLLAAAGSVSEGYFRQRLALLEGNRLRFPGVKMGGRWLITREDGDRWLREKKDTVIVEEGSSE